MKTGVIAVKCLIGIQQVALGNQARINIAIFEFDGRFMFLMNVWNLGAVSPAQCGSEN